MADGDGFGVFTFTPGPGPGGELGPGHRVLGRGRQHHGFEPGPGVLGQRTGLIDRGFGDTGACLPGRQGGQRASEGAMELEGQRDLFLRRLPRQPQRAGGLVHHRGLRVVAVRAAPFRLVRGGPGLFLPVQCLVVQGVEQAELVRFKPGHSPPGLDQRARGFLVDHQGRLLPAHHTQQAQGRTTATRHPSRPPGRRWQRQLHRREDRHRAEPSRRTGQLRCCHPRRRAGRSFRRRRTPSAATRSADPRSARPVRHPRTPPAQPSKSQLPENHPTGPTPSLDPDQPESRPRHTPAPRHNGGPGPPRAPRRQPAGSSAGNRFSMRLAGGSGARARPAHCPDRRDPARWVPVVRVPCNYFTRM